MVWPSDTENPHKYWVLEVFFQWSGGITDYDSIARVYMSIGMNNRTYVAAHLGAWAAGIGLGYDYIRDYPDFCPVYCVNMDNTIGAGFMVGVIAIGFN